MGCQTSCILGVDSGLGGGRRGLETVALSLTRSLPRATADDSGVLDLGWRGRGSLFSF